LTLLFLYESFAVHQKNIKRTIRKQLKKQFPDWKRLPVRIRREFAIFQCLLEVSLYFYGCSGYFISWEPQQLLVSGPMIIPIPMKQVRYDGWW